jgi:hypothetical protein
MKIETAQPAVQCCADVHFFVVIRTGVKRNGLWFRAVERIIKEKEKKRKKMEKKEKRDEMEKKKEREKGSGEGGTEEVAGSTPCGRYFCLTFCRSTPTLIAPNL